MNEFSEAVAGEWPLVARRSEVETCRRLLKVGSVVLAGLPGVGKTRLSRELAAWARHEGWHVESALGTRAGSNVPLAAVAPLLPDMGEVSHDALIRATLQSLRRRANDQPLLITVDDAHLLDSESAALVHLLAASNSASIVATVTSGQQAPEPITALWKDQLARRVEVQPLSRSEAASLLEAVARAPVDSTVEAQLWEWTLGNALFLRELTLSNAEAGRLGINNGLLCWMGEPVVAQRLHDLIGGRLAAVETGERDALEALALSEPLELHLLRELYGEATFEALERRGLLRVEHHDRRRVARLAHPIYGQVLQSSLPVAAAGRIYTTLADALDRTQTRRADDVLRLVTWREAAGSRVDPALASAAAVRAWQLGQMATCERFARLAVREGAAPFLTVLLAQSQLRQGRADLTLEPLRAKLGDSTVNDADRELILCTLGAALGWGCGHLDEAMALLSAGASSVAEQPLRHATLAVTELMRGETRACLEHGAAVLASSDDMIARSYALTALATTVFGTGDIGLSERILELSDPRSLEAMMLPFAHVRKVSNHTLALVAQGRIHEAFEFAADAYQRSVDDGDDTRRVRWAFVLGFARLFAGDIAAARVLLEDSYRHAPLCEPAMGDISGPFVSIASTLLGEVEREPRPPIRWWFARSVDELARALGPAVPAAARHDRLASAAALAREVEWPFMELFAHFFAVRVGAASSVRNPMKTAAAAVGGPLVAAWVAHADAAAARNAVQLEAVADTYRDLGYRWFEYEAVGAARQVRLQAGAGASRYTARMAELAQLTGLPRPADEPVVDALSAREREVAALVAAGCTDKEVAAKLSLSVRTVNAHLRAVYRKLGVSTRAELRNSDDLN